MTQPLLVKMYATNIITYGNRNFTTIPVEYVVPVKQYIAQNYENYKIDDALAKGYITESDHADIMLYKAELPPPESK